MSEGDGEIERQKKEIERMQNEFRQYKDRVRENEKRAKEKTKKEFMKNLLETLDNLYVVINGDTQGKSEDVKMTYDGLIRAFNIEVISPTHGQCIDEIKHAAIDTITNPNYPENTIVYTVRRGYCFDNEVIRPAEVVVFVGGKQVKKNEETHKEMPEKKSIFDKFFSIISNFDYIVNITFKVIFKDKIRRLEEKINCLIIREREITGKEYSLKKEFEDINKREGNLLFIEQEIVKKEGILTKMLEELKQREENLMIKEQEITEKENLLKDEFEELKQKGENLMIKEQEITEKENLLKDEFEELKQNGGKTEKISDYDIIKSYEQENINKKFEIMVNKKFEIMAFVEESRNIKNEVSQLRQGNSGKEG
ncbi:MAG: nucleotide exchange factor GrpE [Candidatus Altarchaeum sp. CG12_big_fil_rev_8_21_14_0_65_33_22]|nr:MAG: nucleotide exchange factor GrpE [Candidatus Altarchaeum sp. CG12_big_fil_rev_8_21_14_0_65_33_22]PIX48565.1 MAG: nucleotide exchange factor GrpE [Candidatus Altarchaeum sp. CG_4_8_14_3_um_filter_33_2054]